MKVIDLLNKIANDIDVPPKRIRYNGITFDYKLWLEPNKYAYVEEGKNNTLEEYCCFYDLNDEVEIIEEEPREIEVCGSLFTKSEYDKLAGIKEDKKIRKLDFIEENTFSKRQNGMTSEDRRLLDSNFRELGNKINEIIDYLEENK